MGFDDSTVRWFPFGDFTDFTVSICKADTGRGIADFLVRFEPHAQIQLHRHLAETNTLVLSGEHRLYDPDGRVSDVRPAGRFTSALPGPPEREGGAEDPCVVFYSIRSDQDLIIEFLNDDLSLLAPLTISDVAAVWEQQKLAVG